MSFWKFLGEFAVFSLVCDLFSKGSKPHPTSTPIPYQYDPERETEYEERITDLQEQIEDLKCRLDDFDPNYDDYDELQDELECLQDDLDDLEFDHDFDDEW